MSAVALIYPHHLFYEHPALKLCDEFILVEDPLFFKQYAFHKQKLAFHRASMLEYETFLKSLGKETSYLTAGELSKTEDIFDHIKPKSTVYTADLDDDWLKRRLQKGAAKKSIELKELDSPGFINSLSSAIDLLGDKEPLLMASFYQRQRKRTKILMEGEKPVGGKWSFDADNRKKLPKGMSIPERKLPKSSKLGEGAVKSINEEFPRNPGELSSILYHVTFDGAKEELREFLSKRFSNYGDYQDAICESETYLFHSILSPAINSGLLTPAEAAQAVLDYAQKHSLPLNTVEGFIRQLIGWREFMRAAYHKIGRRQRVRNFWGHTRKIPKSFWDGSTGIVPVDCVIKRVLKTGYSHHIERLMILGNFMVLCEFDPDEVYRWFMELFIDAYDWVMVPNVYGMSQYADGGLMTTKPYISGSNYVKKMSDFKPGPWTDVWDGLFWRFIHKHQDFFGANPRLSVMTLQLKKMPASTLQKHLTTADHFLASL